MKCIIIDDDLLTQNLLKSFVKKDFVFECIGVYNNPVEAQRIIENQTIDLIFLDIEMPIMSGFDLLETNKKLPQIIVVSGNEKHALNSFNYNITDYLLKPFSFERFQKAVNKSIDRYIDNNSCRYGDFIFVNNHQSYRMIKMNEVVTVKFEKEGVNISTESDLYKLSTIDEAEVIINEDFFIQINDSVSVNINQIKSISKDTLIVKTNGKTEQIPIEEEFSANLINKYESRK